MDIAVCEGYTILVSAILLLLGSGSPLAILMLLFVPGYVLLAALFPGRNELSWAERIAFSFGLSIAVLSLLGLLLDITPYGIQFSSIILSIVLFTMLVGIVAYWLRIRLVRERRLALTIDIHLPAWKEYSIAERTIVVGLAAAIVVAGSTLAFVVDTSSRTDLYTEFYILGPGDNASGYPTALNVSQTGTVILGIANHEAAKVNYTIRVDLVGVRIVYNATAGHNETLEVNRTTRSWINVTRSDGQNWTQPYTFRINDTGLWKVQFLLFKDGAFSSAYRELHLYVRVS